MNKKKGTLALLGLWKDWGDKGIDAFLKDVYAARERDKGRDVPTLDFQDDLPSPRARRKKNPTVRRSSSRK